MHDQHDRPLIKPCGWWMRLSRYQPDLATTAVIAGSDRGGWRIGDRCGGIHRLREHNYRVDLRTRRTEIHISTEKRGAGDLTLVIAWWVKFPILTFLHGHDRVEQGLVGFVRSAVREVAASAAEHDDLLAVRHRVAAVLRRVRHAGNTGLVWYALNVRALSPAQHLSEPR